MPRRDAGTDRCTRATLTVLGARWLLQRQRHTEQFGESISGLIGRWRLDPESRARDAVFIQPFGDGAQVVGIHPAIRPHVRAPRTWTDR